MSNEIYVKNKNEFVEALANGINNIYLLKDISISTSTGLLINYPCHIYGEGRTISFSGGNKDDTIYLTCKANNIDIIDLTIVGSRNCYNLVKVVGGQCNFLNCKLDTSYNSVISVASSKRVTLTNCEVCNSYNNDCVSASMYADLYLYNCKVHHAYDEGLSTHNYSYCEVWNSEFYHCGYSLTTGKKGAPSCFGGCHIGGGKMGKVMNCYCHDNYTNGIGMINFQKDLPDDVEVCNNNVCTRNGQYGIIFTYCKNLIAMNNVSVSNGVSNVYFGLDPTHKNPIGVESKGLVAGNVFSEDMYWKIDTEVKC